MVRIYGDNGIWPALFLGGVLYMVIVLVYVLTIGRDVPFERYEMTIQNKKDPTKNIGIRLTMKLCSGVQYLSTFGMNNLIMKISK